MRCFIFCVSLARLLYPVIIECQSRCRHNYILYMWLIHGVSLSESVQVAQLHPTLWDPWTIQSMGFSRPGSWGTFPFSMGSSQPGDWTQVSCIADRFFTSLATKKAQEYWSGYPIPSPADLPHPGMGPGSPALQADSLPTELSREA